MEEPLRHFRELIVAGEAGEWLMGQDVDEASRLRDRDQGRRLGLGPRLWSGLGISGGVGVDAVLARLETVGA